MRRLMWFSVGFAIACVLGVYVVWGSWLLLLGIFALAATIAMAFLRSTRAKIVARILLGCTVGLLWLWLFDVGYLADARAQDGKTMQLSIEVTEYGQPLAYGQRADGKIWLDGKQYSMQFYLNTQELLQPGDLVQGEFLLRYTVDAGEKAPAYHQGKGIFLLAYPASEMEISHVSAVPKEFFAVKLRLHILRSLDAVFPEDTLGFARALLLGDRSLFAYETDLAFQTSGISHVIAVSGMHVSILFSLVYMLCGKRKVLTAVFGLPVLFLFAAVAGFTPSIVRACIMQALMILALLCSKEYDPPTALAFAVLVMLAANPLCITSVSFQLSVGCTTGIFLFFGKIFRYLLDEKRLGPAKGISIRAKLTRWFAGSVSVTLSAMLFTTPLCAYYFDTVSLIGILTNLLTLPVVSICFYGIIAACAAAHIWLPLAEAIAWIISWPMRYVLEISRLLSRFPLAAVYTCSVYIVIWLVLCYVLLGIFGFQKRKQPLYLALCMAVSLLAAVGLSWLEPRLSDYTVTVMDVGQGQCILLRSQGKNHLVDCGGDYAQEAADTAFQRLRSQGIDRLDSIILTHYDQDHAGGVEHLLRCIPAEHLYLPDIEPDHALRKALEETQSEKIVWVETGTVLALQEHDLTLIAATEETSGNESGLCILFQPQDCDILITGDRGSIGEWDLLEHVQLPKLELLVVGHHGSQQAACWELLQTTQPKAAVISVGEGNSYGHPSQEVLTRLRIWESRVWRTDQDKTIVFRG